MRFHRDRIVVTGIGVVASNGIGKEEFWGNCLSGMSGIKPITLFDTSAYRCHLAGEISNFQPEKYLGSKGLRNLDRTTLLSLVAAKLALDDAQLKITEENTHEIGIVLGSTMGSVHSISSFDIESLCEGPRYVNPAQFPNTVINSPASQIAIRFRAKAINTTIGTGFSASLDAIEYAADMLHAGRVKTVLVGGAEELCIEIFNGFHEFHLLAPENKPQRNGRTVHGLGKTFLGEGAGLLILETKEFARSHGRTIQAELLALAGDFQSTTKRSGTRSSVIERALRLAGIKPTDVSSLSYLNGNSRNSIVVNELLGKHIHEVSKINARALLGECISAMGALEVIASIGEIQREGGIALVETSSPTGTNVAVVLKIPKA